MHQTDATKLAAELVKAAIAAGWMTGCGTGQKLAENVGDAIEQLAKRIKTSSVS